MVVVMVVVKVVVELLKEMGEGVVEEVEVEKVKVEVIEGVKLLEVVEMGMEV